MYRSWDSNETPLDVLYVILGIYLEFVQNHLILKITILYIILHCLLFFILLYSTVLTYSPYYIIFLYLIYSTYPGHVLYPDIIFVWILWNVK